MDVVLHVGTPKTGTTAVQHALAHNETSLNDHGWTYATTGRGEYHNHRGLMDSLGFTHGELSGDEPETLRRLREHLDDEIARHGRAIISQEMLCRFPYLSNDQHASFARFVDGLDIRVVVYLRRPDRWFESLYAEMVRVGREQRSPEAAAAAFGEPYRGFATSYAAILDFYRQFTDDVVVRVFDRRTLVRGDIVNDFLHVLRIPYPLDDSQSQRNVSPSSTTILALRLLLSDRSRARSLSRADLRQLADTIDDLAPGPHPPLLPPGARARLLLGVRDEIVRIATDLDTRSAIALTGIDHPTGDASPHSEGELRALVARAVEDQSSGP